MDHPNPQRELTAGCLFGGMGGFAEGLAEAGFRIRWANDSDEFACAAFRHRFPEVTVVAKDIRQLYVQGDGLTPVDVLAGGFPCQSFSQAGSRRGFKDPRGQLFFEIPRLLAEYGERRPALVVLENVPYLLYGDDGGWFDQVRRALRRAGYWFRVESCWTVNVKDHTDLPQDRERLFMVAASRIHFPYNPFSPPLSRNGNLPEEQIRLDEIIDRSQPGSEDAYLPPENRYYKMIDQAMAVGESRENLYQLRRSYVREKKNGMCPTLTANMGGGGHNVPFLRDQWGIRRLSVAEVARLQGFDMRHRLFPEMPEAEQYRLLGNAVCVRLARLIGRMCAQILSGEN